MKTWFVILLLLVGCKNGPGSRPFDTADTGDTADTSDTGDTEQPIVDGPSGFVGGPCGSDNDCDYSGGVCLKDGFPRGMCSLACDKLCPDETGYPTTFCVPTSALPDEAEDNLGSGGACVSRCDLGEFDVTLGCRTDYGCVIESRNTEPATKRFVCLPGEDSDLSQCHADLAALGVDFEPTIIPDNRPSGASVTCHVEDAVVIHPPMHGVNLVYGENTANNPSMSCEGAKALSATVLDVKTRGVTKIHHYGTYNCRLIAGSSSVSRHGFGDAIDLFQFDFANGDKYTLIDDWEHNTSSPVSTAARWLYDAAYRWHDLHFWRIILTPNYNAAHDNHFHVDLTPGSNFIGATDGTWIGPSPYEDCGGGWFEIEDW